MKVHKIVALCIIAALLVVAAGGCLSPAVRPTVTPVSTAVPTAVSTAVPTAVPTATPTATPTAVPSMRPTAAPPYVSQPLIPTTISVWGGYMGMPAEWLNYPVYNVALKQGSSEQVRYVVNAADGTHPCGAANYYIDNYAAGGVWDITHPTAQYGCSAAGMPGGAGGLYLYPSDTAKLAVGWHDLKIDYLGDNTYAPSEFEASFLVTAA